MNREKIDELSAAKQALLRARLKGVGAPLAPEPDSPPEPGIPQRSEEAPPLSFAQERLWYIDQVAPGTPLYNIPMAWHLRGELDAELLRRTLNEIVQRHEVLRTTFRSENGRPVQAIAPSLELDLPLTDLSGQAEVDRQSALEAYLAKAGNEPFDLESGPLVRTELIRIDAHYHVLFFMPHHIAFDGTSIGLFAAELSALYEAFVSGNASPLPPLPMQYADYAMWQRETADEADMERQLAYWKQRFATGVPPLDVHPDLPRPAERSYHGAPEHLRVSAESATGVAAACRKEGVTPFMYLLAVYAATLHRVGDQDEVAVACPVAERSHPASQKLIGFFVNTMILRTRMKPSLTFREFLQELRGECLDAFENMTVPFQRVVEAIKPDRASALTPLFQTLFAFADVRSVPHSLGTLSMREHHIDHDGALTDLLMEVQLDEDGIDIAFIYSTDLFTGATAARILRHFETILLQVLLDPDSGINEIPLLNDDDRARLTEWNQTTVDYGSEGCVHKRVEALAARTPQAIAILCEKADGSEEQMTYAQLNARANRVAHCLRAQGIGPDRAVGLAAERSCDTLAGVLGILKAGGAYVPLDPDYPGSRLAVMLEDAGASIVLATRETAATFADLPVTTIPLDSPDGVLAEQPDTNPDVDVSLEHLAYILYTSGSTGKPKGVAMPHRPLANLIAWQVRDSVMGEGGRTLHFAPLSFDVSFQELFSTWCSGGTLVLIPNETRLDGHDLVDFINRHNVERLFLPFVALQVLAEASPHAPPTSLKEVMTAGEQLQVNQPVIDLFTALPDCILFNHYGPTEAHVVTSLKLSGDPRDWPSLPSIGRPIGNVRIHILDTDMRETPVGQPGELYIGGDAVARGYLNRPDMTAEKFIADPFSSDPDQRLYRSGDLARYLPDGTIEFLGRADTQLKVRGFRVEPGEIEAALVAHEGVAQSVVTLWGEGPGDQRLTAYYVPPDGARAVTGTVLRKHLRQTLPDYMVPQFFVEVERLPVTSSGKVDRKNLPSPFTEGHQDDYVAPRNPTETLIADVWQEILGIERVGVRDNFFNVGGHSLLAMRAIARIAEETGVRLTPHNLLFNSLEQLAPLCEATVDPTAEIPETRSGWRGLVTRIAGRNH